MLALLKERIKLLLVPLLYGSGFLLVGASIFLDASWGFYSLVALIPQPNVWYKLHEYPLGKDFLDLLIGSCLLGLLGTKRFSRGGESSGIIAVFVAYSYFELWVSSVHFNLPPPLTSASSQLSEFKNYAEMILLYYISYSIGADKRDREKTIVLIAFVVFIIALRSYRNFSAGSTFSYEKRAEGPFAIVGLGANHTGAFFAHFGAMLFGMFLCDADIRRRVLFMGASLLSLHPIFFSYSRGAYLAVLGALGLLGLVHKRIILVGIGILLLSWQVLLPASVVDRITMTEDENGQLENSAGDRLDLWKEAIGMFASSPVFGVGYRGYSLSIGGKTLGTSGGTVQAGFDTHNIWLKTLCEQGIIGFALFALVLLRAFRSGCSLFSRADVPFEKGLGLGFMACVVAMAITNIFGDRWSYFEVGSYFWILWGVVDRSLNVLLVAPGATREQNSAETAPAGRSN